MKWKAFDAWGGDARADPGHPRSKPWPVILRELLAVPGSRFFHEVTIGKSR